MVNQKAAVYNAVSSITNFEDGDKVTLTTEGRAQIISIVAAGFEANEVSMSEVACQKYLGNPQELKKYTSGLVNNWLRKDTRMNGGDKYTTKNPGSRAGNGDSMVKNLKALKSTLTDQDKIDQVEQAIQQRQAELKAEKAKDVAIDFDQIPAELKATLGL